MGCDLAQSKTVAVKVVATIGIVAWAQLLTALITGTGNYTSHTELSIISISHACSNIFMLSFPLRIFLIIICKKLIRSYIFLK